MKPTHQEKEILRDYLHQVLTYRETFEEIYDHALMAVENKPRHRFFETVINEVIGEEFGGINGLVEIENDCKKATVKDALKNKRTYWSEFLTMPGIVFVISLFAGIFYMSRIKFFDPLLLLFVMLFPIIMLATRAFRSGLMYGNNKESASDDFFQKMAYKPLKWIFILPVLNIGFTEISNLIAIKIYASYKVYLMIGHYLNLIILLIGILHIIVFIRLYRDEFKNKMVSSKG